MNFVTKRMVFLVPLASWRGVMGEACFWRFHRGTCGVEGIRRREWGVAKFTKMLQNRKNLQVEGT